MSNVDWFEEKPLTMTSGGNSEQPEEQEHIVCAPNGHRSIGM